LCSQVDLKNTNTFVNRRCEVKQQNCNFEALDQYHATLVCFTIGTAQKNPEDWSVSKYGRQRNIWTTVTTVFTNPLVSTR